METVMKILLSTFVIALTLLTGAAYAEADKQSPLTEQQAMQLVQEGKHLYSCPMHEHVFSDKDGKCPVCGMKLSQATSIKEGKAVFDGHDMNTMEKK